MTLELFGSYKTVFSALCNFFMPFLSTNDLISSDLLLSQDNVSEPVLDYFINVSEGRFLGYRAKSP